MKHRPLFASIPLLLLAACSASSQPPAGNGPAAADGGAPDAAPTAPAPTRAWSTSIPFSTATVMPNLEYGGAALDASGDLLIAASVANQVSGRVGDATVAGPFVAKIDPSGNVGHPVFLSPPSAGAQLDVRAAAFDAQGGAFLGGDLFAYVNGQVTAEEVVGANAPTGAAIGSSVVMPGPGGNLSVVSIAALPGGGFAMAGDVSDGTQFGSITLHTALPFDSYVAAFDAKGGALWAKPLGHYGREAIQLAADTSGGVDVALGASPEGPGTTDLWAARFRASNGDALWSVDLGPLDFEAETEIGGVAIAPSGDDVIVASLLDDDDRFAGPRVFTLSAADGSTKATASASTHALAPELFVTALASDGAGGAWIAGGTHGATLDSFTLPNAAVARCWIGHFAASGALTWADSCADTDGWVGVSLLAAAGRVAVVGYDTQEIQPLTPALFATSYAVP